MIDSFQEYREFIGIDQLRAVDYLRELIVRHHQRHQQQRKTKHNNTLRINLTEALNHFIPFSSFPQKDIDDNVHGGQR